MKHKSLSEIPSTEFVRIARMNPAALRRRRLERLADLLETHVGPIRLFAMIEAVPGRKRRAMRRDSSPFSIAFVDPVFRAEGLASDTIGDASAFFGLSSSETHELVCDCHYFGPVTGQTVAERARHMAAHPSLAARFRNIVAGFSLRGAHA
jgi:hypothetical protein